MSITMAPDFNSRSFLIKHIDSILEFYETNVDDPNGGFYQNFKDDGQRYDQDIRHLVSSTRFIYNYARTYIQFGREIDLDRVSSGLSFLRNKHKNPKTGGYAWLIKVTDQELDILDDANHCYGMAFVMLAYSWAYRAGVKEAKNYLDEIWLLMEKHFWDNSSGLYKDEFCAEFKQCQSYRGQNSNMHTCEALIAAYQATDDTKYLDRAYLIADNIVNRQTKSTDGLIWEHYSQDWTIDWEYNKQDPKNLFKPWGFQLGHQTEWAKLLLIINQYKNRPWLLKRAQQLFDKALASAWDNKNDGICYSVSPTGEICDGDKYFWVQAESIVAAALLADASGDPKYNEWYKKIWSYSWTHLIDHQYGAWYRVLNKQNQKLSDCKSPIGKTDYHTMGACYDLLAMYKGLID